MLEGLMMWHAKMLQSILGRQVDPNLNKEWEEKDRRQKILAELRVRDKRNLEKILLAEQRDREKRRLESMSATEQQIREIKNPRKRYQAIHEKSAERCKVMHL